MEIRRLNYFVRVAEDGSLTKASGVLRIAQPALSRQMRLLEDELGVKLFSRTARGMQLTEEGEHLRASVAGPLRELELALANVRSLSTRIEGNLVIGMPPGVAAILATPLALHMDAGFPGLSMRIIEGPTGSLVDWLNRGMVDLAFLEESSRDDRLADRPLLEQRLCLIGAADAGLSPDQAMPFAEVARLPLVIPSHHLGMRGAIEDAATRTRATLNIRFHADSPRLITDLVARGMGYGVLPESYFREELAAGRLTFCAITEPEPAIALYLSARRNSRTGRGRVAEIEDAIMAFARAQIGALSG
jgi:DNA-binding transcriptional LysR family regulator